MLDFPITVLQCPVMREVIVNLLIVTCFLLIHVRLCKIENVASVKDFLGKKKNVKKNK